MKLKKIVEADIQIMGLQNYISEEIPRFLDHFYQVEKFCYMDLASEIRELKEKVRELEKMHKMESGHSHKLESKNELLNLA